MSETITLEVILFLCLSLLLTIVSFELKKKYKVPVYPALLVFGILLKLIGPNISKLSDVISLTNELSPEVLELIILPVLIFEASFMTDWSQFKRNIKQIVAMSSSLLLFSMTFTAISLKIIFQFDFSWTESFLLSLILNSTDYFTLKSVLKDVHLKEKIFTLIEGESLLNQASVYVVFGVINESIESENDFGLSLLYFIRLALGGFAIGLLFSFGMGLILKRLVNEYIQETNLTLVTCYLLFWICQNQKVKLSGPVAVLTFGLYMAAYGKVLISPIVEKNFCFVFRSLANYGQCLIFIFAGVNLPRQSIFNVNVFGKVFGIYFFLHFLRAFSIFLHYPLLKYIGNKVSFKENIVITIAGLKGVTSSILALITFQNNLFSEDFKSVVLLVSVIIVGFSICCDSFFMKTIVHKFNMDEISTAEETILLGITSTIIKETDKKIKKLRNKPNLLLVKWEEVLKISGPKGVLEQIMKNSYIGRDILKSNANKTAEFLTELYNSKIVMTEDILSNEIRKRFYCILRGIYWHKFVTGQCQGTSALILIDSCNKALNSNFHIVNDWDILQKTIYNQKTMNWLKNYTNSSVVGPIFRRIIYNNIIHAYDIANTFVRAYNDAEIILRNMDFIEIDPEILQNIIEEAHTQIELCEDFIKEFITDTYPEIISDVQCKMACYMLLNNQRKVINKIYEHGVVKLLEYRHLLNAIDANLKLLAFKPSPKILTLAEMLKNRFPKSTNEDIKKILPYVTEIHFQPETKLFEEDSPINGAYLIFSGTVYEYNSIMFQTLSISNIAGAYALTDYFPHKYVTTATTKTVVIAAFIPTKNLLGACFLEDIYKEAAKHILLFNKESFGLKETENSHIEKVVEGCSVWYLNEGSPINLKRGALVIRGKIRKNKEIFSVLRPSKRIIESSGEAIVLIFPPYFGSVLKQHRFLGDAFASYSIKYYGTRKNKNHEEFRTPLTTKFKLKEIDVTSDFED